MLIQSPFPSGIPHGVIPLAQPVIAAGWAWALVGLLLVLSCGALWLLARLTSGSSSSPLERDGDSVRTRPGSPSARRERRRSFPTDCGQSAKADKARQSATVVLS